jgi:hypothetical protein
MAYDYFQLPTPTQSTEKKPKLQPLPNPRTIVRDDELMEVPSDREMASKLLPNAFTVFRDRGRENIEYGGLFDEAIIAYVTMAVHIQWLKYAPERLIEISALISRSARGNALYEMLYDQVFPNRDYWYNRGGKNPRFLTYTCPSTGRFYACLIPHDAANGKDPDAMMAWKFHLTTQQYANLTAEA